MILPIVAYGHPVLKKMSEEIQQDHPGLNELINNVRNNVLLRRHWACSVTG